MKNGKLTTVLCLCSCLLIAATAQARPRPDAAADYADKQAAWQKHQALVESSPYAGLKWRNMGLGDTDRIGRILIDPNDSDRIYVAALGKLYTPGGQRGIYRSTDGGSGSAIYKSTDGGDSWLHLEGGLPRGDFVGRIGLAVSAASPETLYASIDNQQQLPEDQWNLGDRPVNAKRLRYMSKEEFLAQDKNEIERFIRNSDFDVNIDADKLIDWLKSDQISIQDIIDELNDANANLFNTDIVGLQVWRSDDAGKTWFTVQGRNVHGDYQSMWINPQHPEHLLIGNDGGAAETAARDLANESTADVEEEKEEETLTLPDTPYSESIRLGHILYAIPGNYTIRVSVGENSDSTEMKIKAPKDYEPRVKEPYKLRGKK